MEEFESLLSSQESLVKQMAEVSLKSEEGSALLARRKSDFRGAEKKKEGAVTHSKNSIKCYRCGKIGHMRKTCRVKLKQTNVAEAEKSGAESKAVERGKQSEEDWTKCFMAKVGNVSALACINPKQD